MRFTAIFALVASASAMRLNLAESLEGAQCVDAKEASAIFHAIDTNGNGEVGKKELVAAIKAFA